MQILYELFKTIKRDQLKQNKYNIETAQSGNEQLNRYCKPRALKPNLNVYKFHCNKSGIKIIAT